ncbi:hypothetical protein [Methylobacterium fujisawaense]|jgi:hypothetical protein
MSALDDLSRPRPPARLGLTLLGLAVAVGLFSLTSGGHRIGNSSPAEEGTSLVYGGSFYRFEASYIVRETGEPLSVDVVVPCQRTLLRYVDHGRVRSTSDEADAPNPWLTTAHARTGSLVVSVPNLCDGKDGARAGRGKIVPEAVWYPGADRLADGAAAVAQSDYAQPGSKVEFLSAAVVPSGFYPYAAFVRHRLDTTPPAGEGTPFGYSQAQVAAGVPAKPPRIEARAE